MKVKAEIKEELENIYKKDLCTLARHVVIQIINSKKQSVEARCDRIIKTELATFDFRKHLEDELKNLTKDFFNENIDSELSWIKPIDDEDEPKI